jgi:hypothetical protein
MLLTSQLVVAIVAIVEERRGEESAVTCRSLNFVFELRFSPTTTRSAQPWRVDCEDQRVNYQLLRGDQHQPSHRQRNLPRPLPTQMVISTSSSAAGQYHGLGRWSAPWLTRS